jgi:hypothetical protein
MAGQGGVNMGEGSVRTDTSKVDQCIPYEVLLSIALGMKELGYIGNKATRDDRDCGTEDLRLLSACIGLTILRAEQNRERARNSAEKDGKP